MLGNAKAEFRRAQSTEEGPRSGVFGSIKKKPRPSSGSLGSPSAGMFGSIKKKPRPSSGPLGKPTSGSLAGGISWLTSSGGSGQSGGGSMVRSVPTRPSTLPPSTDLPARSPRADEGTGAVSKGTARVAAESNAHSTSTTQEEAMDAPQSPLPAVASDVQVSGLLGLPTMPSRPVPF